jgi:hypothetical protein
VFRDAGSGGEIIYEVNSEHDTNIRDKPTLFSMVISSYPLNPTGKTFQYQLEAFNAILSSKSQIVSYILASVPAVPAAGPVNDPSITSSI